MVTNNSNAKHIQHWAPATYRIEVEGHLNESWFDRFAAMRITARKRSDQTSATTLVGRLRDQAELSDVLNSLCDLHRSILKAEVVNGE